MLVLLTQYVSLKFPYTSICLSFGNSLDIIIHAAMVEHIPLRPNILTYRTL